MRFTYFPESTVPGEPPYRVGKLYVDGFYFGNLMEVGNDPLPRGKHRLGISWSHHFRETLPELVGTAIWILGKHPGAHPQCLRIGSVRTAGGLEPDDNLVQRLVSLIQTDEDCGFETVFEVCRAQ